MSTPQDSRPDRYQRSDNVLLVDLFVFMGVTVTPVLLLVGAACAIFLGWLGWAMFFHANPTVSSELVNWDQVDDHTTIATIRVTFGDDWVDAECTVRAIADDKTIVGQVVFTPGQAEGPDYDVEIATDRRPTAVESLGCTAEGQPRPR